MAGQIGSARARQSTAFSRRFWDRYFDCDRLGLRAMEESDGLATRYGLTKKYPAASSEAQPIASVPEEYGARRALAATRRGRPRGRASRGRFLCRCRAARLESPHLNRRSDSCRLHSCSPSSRCIVGQYCTLDRKGLRSPYQFPTRSSHHRCRQELHRTSFDRPPIGSLNRLGTYRS
jgi:hypothetical protein